MHVGVHLCVFARAFFPRFPLLFLPDGFLGLQHDRQPTIQVTVPYWAPPFEGRGSFITGHSWNVVTVSPPGSWAS